MADEHGNCRECGCPDECQWYARATAAEQRVAELEVENRLLRARVESDLVMGEARLREVEAERDRWIARAKEAYQFIGSNDEATVETLLAAKEQAEQTTAGLREALDRFGVHDETCAKRLSLISLVPVAMKRCDCGLDAALHGQAARDDEPPHPSSITALQARLRATGGHPAAVHDDRRFCRDAECEGDRDGQAAQGGE